MRCLTNIVKGITYSLNKKANSLVVKAWEFGKLVHSLFKLRNQRELKHQTANLKIIFPLIVLTYSTL